MTASRGPTHRVGKPLEATEAAERATQAAVLGDTLNLRVLSAIGAGVPVARLAETLHVSAERAEHAVEALQRAAIVQRDRDEDWTLTARAWVRFGRLLADVPSAAAGPQRLTPVAALPESVESVARDLAYRFASTFSAETVTRYVAESYLLLSQRSDTRKESYSPAQDSWHKINHLRPGKSRHQVIGRLPVTTTCELMSAASADPAAKSLGLVYPTDVDRLEFEPHPKWTPEQLAKMQDRILKESTALIPMSGSIPSVLKEPAFKVRYRYRCESAGCRGHQGRILDWELTALQNRLRHDGKDVKAGVTEKFLDQMFAADRRTGFYMGNFELAARRGKFSVLGVYWPKAEDAVAPQPALF